MPNLSPYVPAIAAILALGLIAAVLYRRFWLSTSAEEPSMKPGEPFEPGAHPSDAAAEFGRWQVEMHEFAREIKGELDSKMAALQELIAQARAESERLERLIAQAQQGESVSRGSEAQG